MPALRAGKISRRIRSRTTNGGRMNEDRTNILTLRYERSSLRSSWPGLDPAIQARDHRCCMERLDGRLKGGHDELSKRPSQHEGLRDGAPNSIKIQRNCTTRLALSGSRKPFTVATVSWAIAATSPAPSLHVRMRRKSATRSRGKAASRFARSMAAEAAPHRRRHRG